MKLTKTQAIASIWLGICSIVIIPHWVGLLVYFIKPRTGKIDCCAWAIGLLTLVLLALALLLFVICIWGIQQAYYTMIKKPYDERTYLIMPYNWWW